MKLTRRGAAPNGVLYAWNIDGSLQQRLPLPRPNNVDGRRGVLLGGQLVDLAVVTMRAAHELRVFAISPETRMLTEVTSARSLEVFKSPDGLALYPRHRDHALFAIVSSKHDSSHSQLRRLLLEDDGTGEPWLPAGSQVTWWHGRDDRRRLLASGI
ncbi:MAG: phytase [candidate division KSB1 bacterium]|nr:phytase [candidate division KSB1 bacterium]MDZ7276144.1 phytase [candidate division KSB1 bacterium]MDZ7287076.1 phytase [candidate division KSB1 bacterium]MDZ7296999.1 phytase [candidate division KSB1 bacterium]MDZ7306171.1 phytase [candidate division KSB1 bacterium]